MNTKSFTLKVATLSFTVATAFVSAQSLEMTGNVPVDFTVAGKSAAAGTYKIVEQRPGLVVVRTADGKNVALRNMQVKTKETTSTNFMTFERKNNVYEFAGYCAVGHGCWSTGTTPKSERIEIALSR